MNHTENSKEVITSLLNNLPSQWLALTTHRLDIYNEELAKAEFLQSFDALTEAASLGTSDLKSLPTAYDYIRLGHPLSCVLEWALAKNHDLPPAQVITFASQTMSLFALLRLAHLEGKSLHLFHDVDLPEKLGEKRLQTFYSYHFKVTRVSNVSEIPRVDSDFTVFVTQSSIQMNLPTNSLVDVTINLFTGHGSAVFIHSSEKNDENRRKSLVSEIQHVRRRETIAMTPASCYKLLKEFALDEKVNPESTDIKQTLSSIHQVVRENSGSSVEPLIASSGLSIQYAILMGLIENASQKYPGKTIQLMVPSNCYGGTNDQARRAARCFSQVDYHDLHVDGENDMIQGLDESLKLAANRDSVPLIIAEIPTNPRVEVPSLDALKRVLGEKRMTEKGDVAVAPILVLDQTFCPNVPFLADNSVLSDIQVISYVSGSKFPSAGHCTAGYCTANEKAKELMPAIESHLSLCDNQATQDQLTVLAQNMPSMNERIQEAFENTRRFVRQIRDILPAARINFVPDDLTPKGFTPSVFSLDLPTRGSDDHEQESQKRELNKRLIQHMIRELPEDCKNCVSYGQPKASYWTIPATSTQGTTQEGHKDYIVRVSISPTVDISKLGQSFEEFCKKEGLS